MWVAHPPLTAALLLLITVPLTVGAENHSSESRKRDLATAEQQVQDLEQDLALGRDRRRQIEAELEHHERAIAELAQEGHRLVTRITEQEHVLERLHSQAAIERTTLEQERAALGDLLRSAYALGRGGFLRILLGQEDANRLSRVMAYYGFLNRSRVRRIEAVTRRTHRLGELTREAGEERARLVALARRQDETRTRLARVWDERSAVLSALEQTIATRANRVEALRAQVEEMRRLLKWLGQAAQVLPEAGSQPPPLHRLRGRLAWPLVDASLLSRYDSLKEDGIQRWDGVVLAVEEGAPVRAVHPGRVAYADWLRGFGLLLIIEHDDDYMTLYGYNRTLLKEPGEWVAAGETIALSGSSGGRLLPGLYFAIRYRGRPLNPEQWCRRPGEVDPEPSAIVSPEGAPDELS